MSALEHVNVSQGCLCIKKMYKVRSVIEEMLGFGKLILEAKYENIFNSTLVFQLQSEAGESCLQLFVFLHPERRVE